MQLRQMMHAIGDHVKEEVELVIRELWRVRQDVPMTSPHPSEQAADALRADILDGRLSPGERLPGQRELGEKYGVAPNTMAAALKILEEEGLVEMAPRRRSRVLPPAVAMKARLHGDGLLRPTDSRSSGHNDMKHGSPGTDASAIEALNLAPDTTLSVRQAVLLHTGAPWALQTLFTQDALEATGLEAVTIAPFTAGPLQRETRHINSWTARPATPEERSLLRSRSGAAVFELRRVGFTDERPTSYLLTVVRADRVTIVTESAS
ncbi:GntR family transcriptional regulator [Streptomyces sp. NPDC059650]|uniref:GntR family transcriptional regulator n=1 Tax=Streptomyces sp. NPDC059650 TaxID=3346896 RepID=UPI0036A6F52D